MLHNYQLYSFIQLIFFTVCAYKKILSLDTFIAHNTEKTQREEAKEILGLSCRSPLFNRVNSDCVSD